MLSRPSILLPAVVLSCFLVTTFQTSTSFSPACFAQVALPKAIPTNHDPLKDCTIIRCLFKEGRLVVKHEGKLVVLRQGDKFPGGGPVIACISPDQIVLRQGTVVRKVEGKTVAGPESIIVITPQPGGKWKTEVFSSESDAPQGVLAGAPLVIAPSSQHKPEEAKPIVSPTSDSQPKPSQGQPNAP